MRCRSGLYVLLVVLALSALALPPTSGPAHGQGMGTPNASPTATPATAANMPAEEDVPEGLVTIDDRQRTLDEVSAGFRSPDAARAQFEAWGWKGNSVRAFHIAGDATPDPSAIDGIYISVHEFGTPEDAANALDYSVKIHLAATDLEEMPLEPMGDSSVAIYGVVSYGNEVTLYVQKDTLLIRLSASSPEGDPRPEAIELVRTMLRG